MNQNFEVIPYDVIVVGGGAAGMAAALSAAETGASVMLVEAASVMGGALALSGGTFLAAGTAVQREAGYEDDVDDFFNYFLTFSQWNVEPSLVRTYVDNAGAALDWLVSIGVPYKPENVAFSSLERFPRCHRVIGEGKLVAEKLIAAVRRTASIDVALGQRVRSLVVEDGVVVGVRTDDDELRGHSVVLVSGSFIQDPELMAKYFPDSTLAGDKGFNVFPDTCRGDGLRMALRIGAGTSGFNTGSLLLGTGLIKEIEPFPPGWRVLINNDGRRYVKETGSYSIQDRVLLRQGGAAWVVFDDAAKQSAHGSNDVRFGSGFWAADTIDSFVASGDVLKASSLHELAVLMKVPPEALVNQFERYNADCDRGVDTEFYKSPADLIAMRTAPFYAVRILPVAVGVTGFGVRIDPEAHVLSTGLTPIPGLFAAGDMTGNVMGSIYIASGLSVGKAITFGRIAGTSAAAHAAAQTGPARSTQPAPA